MGDIFRKAIESVEPFNKYPVVFGPVAYNNGIFVDKLLKLGKKIDVNNSKLHWPKHTGYKWHNGTNVIVPDIKSFHGSITAALNGNDN